MICLAMRKELGDVVTCEWSKGKSYDQWWSKMIIWDMEDDGGSTVYAMSRRDIFIDKWLVLDWTMSRMAELLPGYGKAIIDYGWV